MMRYISPKGIAEGMRDAQRGLVQNMQVQDHVISAEISGPAPLHVIVNADQFPVESSCSCASLRPCRHMAAVFYHLSKNMREARHLPSDNRGPQYSAPGKASESRISAPAPAGIAGVLPEQDRAETWSRYFSEVEQKAGGAQNLTVNAATFITQMNHVLTMVSTWKRSTKLAYVLSAHFFFLSALLGSSPTAQPKWMGGYGLTSRDYLIDNVMREIDMIFNSASSDDRAVLTRDFSVSLAANGHLLLAMPERQMWMATVVYQKLWTNILRKTDLVEAEVRWVEGLLQDLPAEPRSSISDILAYLYMLAGQDEKSWALIEGVRPTLRFRTAEPMLAILKEEQVARFHAWMKWLSAFSEGHDPSLEQACSLWRSLVEKYPEARPDYEAYLVAHLPYSERTYRVYLLQIGLFHLWADRYLFENYLPSDIPRNELRIVEDQSREVLLPLYHQAVENNVVQKNRKAYKVAVRLLAKLRTHYNKLKRQQEWKRFIEKFLQVHGRQRALIEEMKARRLID
jgi:hypothetical protein